MTKTIDPETADRAADAAHQAVGDAERAIVGGRRIGVDKLTALVTRARHADLEAAAVRDQAARDREQARREALSGVGGQADALAEVGAEGVAEALAELAATAQRARQAAAAWDTQLAEVGDAATALGCTDLAPGGPREADERIAVTRNGTVHNGEAVLQPIGNRIGTCQTE